MDRNDRSRATRGQDQDQDGMDDDKLQLWRALAGDDTTPPWSQEAVRRLLGEPS
jgi:hypothetical protein